MTPIITTISLNISLLLRQTVSANEAAEKPNEDDISLIIQTYDNNYRRAILRQKTANNITFIRCYNIDNNHHRHPAQQPEDLALWSITTTLTCHPFLTVKSLDPSYLDPTYHDACARVKEWIANILSPTLPRVL